MAARSCLNCGYDCDQKEMRKCAAATARIYWKPVKEVNPLPSCEECSLTSLMQPCEACPNSVGRFKN